MPKKVTISFKTTPQGKMVISERASERGFSVSEYCETIILDCVEGGRDVSGGRGDRILSEDDLDAIAGRVSLELEALEIHQAPVANRVEYPEIGGAQERPAISGSVEAFVGALPLSDSQATNILGYIEAARRRIGISKEEVIIRMLAYTYEHQAPRRGGMFAGGLGYFDKESVQEALKNPKR